jgi:signal transduction histidine kinase
MQGFAQALIDDYGTRLDDTGLDYARRISTAARRLDRMIQDLLAFEQLATLEPSAAPVDLEQVVQHVLAGLSAEITVAKAEVNVVRPLGTVRGNRRLLEKVLRELLSNALRFVHPDRPPSIRIWTETSAAGVTVLVEDNGLGISPEHQTQVFEPFVRLAGAETYKGTGIGLAIVKRSIERMGGTVAVESEGGSGTCFRLVLAAP